MRLQAASARIALFAVLAGLVLAGCENNGAVAPVGLEDAQSVRRGELVTINGVHLVRAPRSRLALAGETTVAIGPLGGDIVMDGARLRVPPAAVLVPTPITMTGKLTQLYQWRFGPNGLQFLLPATLTIDADPAETGIPPERLAVAVASDAGNDWRVVGGHYDPETRTISVLVPHFTQYALCQN
jgi:hypothetical protein